MSSLKINSKPNSKSQTSVQSAAIKQESKINVETQSKSQINSKPNSKSQTSVQSAAIKQETTDESAVNNLENKITVESNDIFEGIVLSQFLIMN
jgi:hypothetical protein